MIAAQIHPEDLLDRAKHGALGIEQERLLQTHLDHCAACRFELSLAPALYQNVKLGSRDHALIARAVANVSRVPRYEGLGRFGRKTVSALTLVLALLTGMALASVGAYLWRRSNPTVIDPATSEAPLSSNPAVDPPIR